MASPAAPRHPRPYGKLPHLYKRLEARFLFIYRWRRRPALSHRVSVGGEALELRQEASCLAERIIPLLCEKGQSRALEKVVNGGTGKGMGKPAGGKYCIRSQAVVSRTMVYAGRAKSHRHS